MKRDWYVIKELLNDLEPLHQFNGLNLKVYYYGDHKSDDRDILRMETARLLIEKNYITGLVSKTKFGGFAEISNMNLTFDGHNLLDTLNDDTLWNQITKIAKDQSIKVTFSTLGALTTQALLSIFS